MSNFQQSVIFKKSVRSAGNRLKASVEKSLPILLRSHWQQLASLF